MKRDMNLVRSILLVLEAHEHGYAPQEFRIEGYSDEQVAFHVYLMGQAALLRATDVTVASSRSPKAIPHSLTWDGYEFLEAAREPSRWQAALKTLGNKGAAVTFDILKALLVDMIRREVGLAQ